MDILKKEPKKSQEESLGQNTKQNLPFERIEVENTPFVIIQEPNENEGADYTVTLGKYRLSEKFETKEEAEEDAVREDWNRLIQVIMLVVNNELKDRKHE